MLTNINGSKYLDHSSLIALIATQQEITARWSDTEDITLVPDKDLYGNAVDVQNIAPNIGAYAGNGSQTFINKNSNENYMTYYTSLSRKNVKDLTMFQQ